MADKTASALLAAQAKITQEFANAETREQANPILATGLKNSNYLMTDINSIRESTKRTVYGYQRVKKTATAATTRSYNFTGSQTDTAQVTLSWVTKAEKFSVYHNASNDNIFNKMTDDIAYGLKESMRTLREAYGLYLLATLHTDRTHVVNSTIRNATWDSGNYVFNLVDNKRFFANMQSVMSQHKYYGGLDVIVDSILAVDAREVAANGSNNANNLSYALQGLNIMAHDTLGISAATDVTTNGGIAIALPAYSFAFIPWIPSAYKMGEGDINSYNGKKFVIADNTGLGYNYAVWAYTTRADGSSNGGTVDDYVTHFEVSVDMAVQPAYLSTANETPIFEFIKTA